jgi:hypothetical protein
VTALPPTTDRGPDRAVGRVLDRVLDRAELAAVNDMLSPGAAPYALFIRDVGPWRIMVAWYGFNDRVTIADAAGGWRTGYGHGWCYPRGGPAFLAAALWDPQRHDEPPHVPGGDGAPVGWHKRATDPAVRRAPDRDPGDALNRARCVHGRWVGGPCPACPPFGGHGTATPTRRR